MRQLVLACLLLAGCGRMFEKTGVADARLVAALPAGAKIAGGLRLDRLRQSPLYQKLKPPIPAEIAAYEADVEEIVAAQTGDGKTVVVARGRFDKAKLKDAPLRFLADDIVTTAAADAASGPPEELAASIRAVPAGATAWVVTQGGNLALPIPDRSNLKNLEAVFQRVQSATVALTIAQDVKLAAHAECPAEAEAKQIHGAMKAFVGMARLTTPDNRADLLKVYDAIEVRQEGATVRVQAGLPAELVEKLALLRGGNRIPQVH